MTRCSACGGEFVAGEQCPARGDEGHRRPRGRPAYADDERRSVRLEVRLSPEEAIPLYAWAARRKKSTAEAVREAALKAAHKSEREAAQPRAARRGAR